MNPLVSNLWLIPALPLVAAGLTALAKQPQRRFAATLAIGAMAVALLLSCAAFIRALHASGSGETVRQISNFTWFHFGDAQMEAGNLRLGWVLDPLAAVMLVMVTFVGLLIFIYSVGYMAHDENFTRFFCFLSLFAAAMLGLVIANNLLLLFICWELVGLTSYLLIGFWYHKPSAAAAAKKAFITTRIGDMAFLLGMVWLYSQTGTLLFYDHGQGCLEPNALAGLSTPAAGTGIVAATGIALLIFCGAIGKSGQLPLHVWLPDAMEGPTPVSALIHAATMVAAGVFLVARVYPLMKVAPGALETITWVGAITAVFAASIAVAQTDMKRILAYSTVSQLGFMMLGLGAGGVAVGMFHLTTHAFFKALLFLGAGSVIHGCHEEQDVRCMGGLRKYMPVTFATYAVGMMALSGVPILFSGFWSKDEILHAAHNWPVSRWPFYLGVAGAFLTGFYMTRQICHVFFGTCRLELGRTTASEQRTVDHAGVAAREHPHHELPRTPHESPSVMTVPLVILAVFATLPLGLLGTPAWPWFQNFITGEQEPSGLGRLFEPEVLGLMLLSTIIVALGLGLGWWLYGRHTLATADETDVLERRWPDIFTLLKRKYFVDEIYEGSVIWLNTWFAKACDWLDEWIWGGLVQLVSYAFLGLSWLDRVIDEQVVNRGFDGGCRGTSEGGRLMSRLQDGRVQHYLRIIAIGLVVLVLLSIAGCSPSLTTSSAGVWGKATRLPGTGLARIFHSPGRGSPLPAADRATARRGLRALPRKLLAIRACYEICGLDDLRKRNSAVPEGHLRIAQCFAIGLRPTQAQVPKGRLKRCLAIGGDPGSAVPSGLGHTWLRYPRLKPWAILRCPFGTTEGRGCPPGMETLRTARCPFGTSYGHGYPAHDFVERGETS